tara:strand:- start:7348 stop:10386 length:3039 start_codon:yes stop_codon:yes gene_type:complete
MGGGEVSPPIGARVDLAKRAVSVELAENFVATFTGSMENRAGQQFVAQCKPGSGPHRIIEFEFNTDQTFVLELGNLYMRFHSFGAQILDSTLIKTITGATAANPVVVSSTAHGLSNGDEVYITGVAGMTQLNGRNFKLTAVAANSFALIDLNGVAVDGTGYTAYTSGGTATPPYEVTTPWAAADIADLKYAQSGDVMTLVHPDYLPQELVRIDNDTWSLAGLNLTPAVFPPFDITVQEKTAPVTTFLTNITQANPAVVTDTAHGLSTGDEIRLTGVVGMTEINNFIYEITVLSVNTFSIAYAFNGAAVNSTTFTAYTSGGTAEALIRPRSYAVTAVSADGGEESLRGVNDDGLAITNITQANPAVVTFSTGHGLEPLAQIRVSSVLGMTELNGARFRAEFIDETSISLKYLDNTDVDSTTFTAYAGSGVVRTLYTIAYSSAATDWDNKVRWSAILGADRYIIYATDTGGQFGKIGESETTSFEDNGLSPDYGDTPPVFRDPFLDLADVGDRNPSTVGFFQQRRVFANSNDYPNRFWMSQLGHFDNFSSSRPPLSDDAITQSISARRINEIQHIVPLSDLVFLTSGGEYRVQAGEGLVITPTTISISPQSYYGSTFLRPIVAGDVALYISPGEFVRDLGFQINSNKFVGRDISVLARHLFDRRTIVDWDYAPAPNALGFLVMSDGDGLFLTYQPDQDIYAWTRSTTRGHYKSTCVVREAEADIIYAIVERVIDGFTVNMLERMQERQFASLSDAFHVDCGLTLDTPITITNITAADPVVVTAPGHGLSNGDIVDLSDILEDAASTNQGSKVSPDYNGVGFVVANATATTFSLQISGADYDGTGFAAYASGGVARKAVTVISGLWHLEGETLVAAANGYVERGLLVTDGSVTLQTPASRVHLGISYFSRLRTLPLSSYGSSGGDIQGRSQNITRLTVQVERTLGMWFGPDINTMREARFGMPALYGQPLEMVTDDIDVTMKANWGKRKQVVIEQRDPLPLSVLTLIPDAIVGGN